MNRIQTIAATLFLLAIGTHGVYTWVDICRPDEKDVKIACLQEILRGCELLQKQGEELMLNCRRAEILLEVEPSCR